MKYQISRHLGLQPDDRERDKYLFQNLYHGTRMLAGFEIWDMFAAYREAQGLGETPLEVRARECCLLEPFERLSEATPLVAKFDAVSAKVLAYRKVEPAQELHARLEQLRQTCKPMATVEPQSYFVWQSPSRIFEVLLSHFSDYLKQEVASALTADLSSAFLQSTVKRPPIQDTLEQQVCSLETSWKRAKEIYQTFGQDCKILILGDDDLVSLALQQFPIKQIDVLELDSRLVRMLKRQANEQVRVFRRDLSLGLPLEFQGEYDVVVSDPMYATAGMEMFLDCCVAGLKPSGSSRLYLSTYPPLLEDPHGFFALLAAKGLTVRRQVECFNRYPFPGNMRSNSFKGMLGLGYHKGLCEVLLSIPYLYAHLFVCGLEEGA